MNYLLDTHTFLWYINGDSKLTETALHTIEDATLEIFLSMGTLWELAILEGLGRIELSRDFVRLRRDYIQANQIQLLPLEPSHLDVYKALPFHHKDPFDRLLIAQAQAERFTIITKDPEFRAYQVPLLW